jgi:hypothetical protein
LRGAKGANERIQSVAGVPTRSSDCNGLDDPRGDQLVERRAPDAQDVRRLADREQGWVKGGGAAGVERQLRLRGLHTPLIGV